MPKCMISCVEISSQESVVDTFLILNKVVAVVILDTLILMCLCLANAE